MSVNELESCEELPSEGDVRLWGRGRRGARGVEQGRGPVMLLSVMPGVGGVMPGVGGGVICLLRIGTVRLVWMMIVISRRTVVLVIMAMLIMFGMRPLEDMAVKVGRRSRQHSWFRNSHKHLLNDGIQVKLIIFDNNCARLSVVLLHNDGREIFIILKLLIQ